MNKAPGLYDWFRRSSSVGRAVSTVLFPRTTGSLKPSVPSQQHNPSIISTTKPSPSVSVGFVAYFTVHCSCWGTLPGFFLMAPSHGLVVLFLFSCGQAFRSDFSLILGSYTIWKFSPWFTHWQILGGKYICWWWLFSQDASVACNRRREWSLSFLWLFLIFSVCW